MAKVGAVVKSQQPLFSESIIATELRVTDSVSFCTSTIPGWSIPSDSIRSKIRIEVAHNADSPCETIVLERVYSNLLGETPLVPRPVDPNATRVQGASETPAAPSILR